jgi:hypothetical protein
MYYLRSFFGSGSNSKAEQVNINSNQKRNSQNIQNTQNSPSYVSEIISIAFKIGAVSLGAGTIILLALRGKENKFYANNNVDGIEEFNSDLNFLQSNFDKFSILNEPDDFDGLLQFPHLGSSSTSRGLLSFEELDENEDDKDELNPNKTNKLPKSQDRRSIKENININGGNEFQLNSYTTGDQGYKGLAVSALSENKFVGLWNSQDQDGSGHGVFGRVFNSTGHALTSEFQVNSYTTDSQGYGGLAVSALSENKFVGLWNSWYRGIYGQIFNSTGHALTSEFHVNSYMAGYDGLAVSALSENKFVVLWNSGDGLGSGVFGRIFNSMGHALTSEFQLNSYTTGDQGYANGLAVSVLSENKFVGLWSSEGQDGSYYGVFGRIFNSTGHALTSEFQLNSYTTSYQGYADGLVVSALSENKFVGLWNSDGQEGNVGTGVYGRIFNSTGHVLTSEFHVNSFTKWNQGKCGLAVSALSEDKFVVVWNSRYQDGGGDNYGVFGRIFNNMSYALTSEFQLNSYTTGDQGYKGLAVSALSENKFVGLWNSHDQDGDGWGIYGRIFHIEGEPPLLLLNKLTIDEGQTVILDSTILNATDVDNDDATLVFTVTNVQHGYFDKTTDPEVPITSFIQQEITNSIIQFVHDGGEIAPFYEVKVGDGEAVEKQKLIMNQR